VDLAARQGGNEPGRRGKYSTMTVPKSGDEGRARPCQELVWFASVLAAFPKKLFLQFLQEAF